MLKKIISFFRLPLKEKWLFFHILFWIIITKFHLKFFGFKKTKHLIENKVNSISAKKRRFQAAKIIHFINLITNYLISGTCLVKALTGFLILKKNSYNPELQIGLKKDGAQLEAHAWLTLDGEIILGHLDDLSEYQGLTIRIL